MLPPVKVHLDAARPLAAGDIEPADGFAFWRRDLNAAGRAAAGRVFRPIGLALRAATLSRGERALTRNNLPMANLQRALEPATTCPFVFMRERAEHLQ